MDYGEEQEIMKRYSDGLFSQLHSGSWDGWFGAPDLRLIPPLAEKFCLYGGDDTIERARRWALAHRYLLADGPPSCAHGLLMLSCPKITKCCGGFDHTSVWVPYDEPWQPFILTHPYRHEVPASVLAYGEAHGLDVSSSGRRERADDPFGDGWYEGTLPIRLSGTLNMNYPWPLGTRATVMTRAFPVRWPEEAEVQ